MSAIKSSIAALLGVLAGAGAISGTFNGQAEGAVVMVGAAGMTTSDVGGAGKDVSLAVTTSSLTAIKAGSGSGTVAGDVGTIDCGTTCSDSYANGTLITLTASPAAGNQFTGWLGPCTGTGTCQFTINGATTAAATFAPAALGAPTLDIDGSTSYDALTDGLLVIRYLSGWSGALLINGAVGPGATRLTDTQVGDYLTDIKPALDIDGNGQVDALTDGLLIMRYLFGLGGDSLIAGAVGSGAIRTTAADIETKLQNLLFPPVRLSVSASRPSGTLDDLPELTWSLQGPTGLALLVRAQGPGVAAPGAGFAGVRPATGPVRYLGASGQWSTTEVVYASPAAAAGTIQPTVPLRLEGEWRFDFMVRDAQGELKTMSLTPVVLTAAPSVRVSLSRRAALAGDAVTGSVALTRGSTARPVRLIAWWQAPDGTAAQLPAADQLAFDGPSADVRLPLLMTRLDGAAPGPWALVARLFDATTGAPLGYGEQSLRVCAGATPLSGTVLGNDGSPLGAGASLAQIQAMSLDRTDTRVAAIGAAGAFSLDLRPGAWLVSALVVDAAGMHRAALPLQVGCATAPIVLRAAAPVAMAAPPVSPQAGTGPRIPVRSTIAAPAACSETDRTVSIPLVNVVEPAVTPLLEHPDDVALWADIVSAELATATTQGLMVNTQRDLEWLTTNAQLMMAWGEDTTVEMRALTAAMQGDVFATLAVSVRNSSRVAPQLNLALAIVANGHVLRRSTRSAWALGGTAAGVVREMVRDLQPPPPDTLLAIIRANLDYPLEPRLNLLASFGSVLPSSQQTVTVHLEDCDGSVYADKVVELKRSPVPFPIPPTELSTFRPVTASTDASGDAHFTVLLGVADRDESVAARYQRSSEDSRSGYPSQDHRYAIQRAQSGQLQFGPTVPVLHPSGSLVLQITSRDPLTGTPQPAKPIVFESNLGGLQQGASGTTDAAGAVTTAVLAGDTVGLGQVDAYIPAPAPPRDTQTRGQVSVAPKSVPPNEGQASEYMVVSSPVALNLIGPSGQVLAGMAVPITGTLLLDGLPLVGTTLTLTSVGGGTLSAASVEVDDTGGFEVTFRAPPNGSGSAMVTAAVEVEGQPVTKDVTITWGSGATDDRLVRVIDTATRRYQVYKVEATTTTAIFDVIVPTAAGTWWTQTNYLRGPNRAVIGVGTDPAYTGIGWGTLDAAGSLNVVHPPVPYLGEWPHLYGESRNGLYSGQFTIDFGAAGASLRIYNSSNALVEDFAPVPSWGLDVIAMGPAGEVLFRHMPPLGNDWYVHTPGAGNTWVGASQYGSAAFSPTGDKIYFLIAPTGFLEVDRATGTSRTLTLPDPLQLEANQWTVEPGGILYLDRAAGLLRRFDLASELTTAIGSLPTSPNVYIVH